MPPAPWSCTPRVPALDLRSRHHVLLTQLASLGDHLPEWVWARWIAYQAIRCEDRGTQTGRGSSGTR